MATITWFGTGLMGSAFVEGLRRRGDDVTVWNRTPEKARALERFGARAERDPAVAASGVEQIHLMLFDDESVDALLERITASVDPGTVVVDHTTVAPAPTAARAQRCAERGIAFVHAPVLMSPQGARDGAGSMIACGPAAPFERVEPELRRMTGELWYVGERPDKAALLKLVGNGMLFFVSAGLADVYALASDAGFETSEAFELFAHFNLKPGLEWRGKRMVEGDFSPAFELSMARKDVRLIEQTASCGTQPLHVLPAIARRMDELLTQGHGSEDLAVLAVDTVSASAKPAGLG